MINILNTIVKANLEKMCDEKEEGSRSHFMRQSPPEMIGRIGFKNLSGYFLPFVYRASTGQILYFGYLKDTPPTISKSQENREGHFAVVVDTKLVKDIAVSVSLGASPRNGTIPSDTAVENLTLTKNEYNKKIDVPIDYFD